MAETVSIMERARLGEFRTDTPLATPRPQAVEPDKDKQADQDPTRGGDFMISPSEPPLDHRFDPNHVPKQPWQATRREDFFIRFLPKGAVEGFINVIEAGMNTGSDASAELVRFLNPQATSEQLDRVRAEGRRDIAEGMEPLRRFAADHLEQTFGTAETPGEVFSEEVMKNTVQALPFLLMMQPVGAPAAAGEFVTAQAGRVFGPSTARAMGGAASTAVGLAEWSVAGTLPDAINEDSPGAVAESAARPFVNITTGIGKLATLRADEVTVEEWVDLTFAAIGAATGFANRPMDARAVNASRREVVDVLSRIPDKKFSDVESAIGKATGVSADAKNEMRSAIREARAARGERSGVTVVEPRPGEPAAPPSHEPPVTALLTGNGPRDPMPPSPLFRQPDPRGEVLPPEPVEPGNVAEVEGEVAPVTDVAKIEEAIGSLTAEEQAELADVLGDLADDPMVADDPVRAESVKNTMDALAKVSKQPAVAEPADAGAATPDPLDAVVAAEAQTANRDIQREGRARVNAVLQQIGLAPQAGRTVTAAQSLQEAMRIREQGRIEAERTARKQLASRIRELKEQHRADLVAGRKEVRETARAKELRIREAQRALKAHIRAAVKNTAIRNKLIALAERVGRGKSQEAVLNQLAEEVANIDKAQARKRLERSVKRARKRVFVENFREGVQEVLASIDLSKPSARTTRTLESRKRFLDKNPNADIPMRAIKELERLDRTPVADMTTEEMEALSNVLENLMLVNRTLKRIRADRESIAREELENTVLAELNDPRALYSLDKMAKGSKLTTRDIPKQPSSGITQIAADPVQNLTLESLVSAISGGNDTEAAWTLYYAPDAAMDEVSRINAEAMDVLNGLIVRAGFELGSEELAKTSRFFSGAQTAFSKMLANLTGKGDPVAEVGETLADVVTIPLESGDTLEMVAAERVYLLASLRDLSTRDLIRNGVQIRFRDTPKGKGYALTDADIQAIKDSAPKWEHDFVDGVLEHVNGPLKKLIQEWSIAEVGYDVTQPETYFHRERLLTEAQRAEFNIRDSTNLYSKVIESTSIVQERIGGTNPIVIGDIFQSFLQHAHEVASVARLAPALRDARQLLDSDTIGNRLANSNRGQRVYRRLRDTYDVMAQGVTGAKRYSWFDQAVDGYNRKFRRVLALNPVVVSYQPISLSTAITEIDAKYVSAAIREGASLDHGIDALYQQHAPYLHERKSGHAGSIIHESLTSGAPSVAGFKPADAWMWAGIHGADGMAIRTIFRAAQIEAEATLPEGADINSAAGQRASRIVKRTQPTFDPLHASGIGIASRQSGLARFMLFFRAQRSKNYDIAIRAALEARDNPKESARKLMWVMVVQSVGISLMKMLWRRVLIGGTIALLTGDWSSRDRNAVEELISGSAEVGLTNVPGVGGAVYYLSYNTLKSMYPEQFKGSAFAPDVSPMSSAAEQAFDGAIKAIAGFTGEKRDFDRGTDGLLSIGEQFALFKFGVPTFPIRLLHKLYNARVRAGKQRRSRSKKLERPE